MTPRVFRLLACLAALFAGLAEVCAEGVTSRTAIFKEAMADFEEGHRLLAADTDRARRLFRSAAAKLSSLADSGIVNGYLEYDLGNCYLQAGDIGNAILHFKRARRLIPTDDLLESNLSIARSRCVTSIRPTSRREVFQAIFFPHYQLALRQRVALGIAAYLAIWVFLLIRNHRRRRWTLVGSIASASVAASFGLSVAANLWADRNEPEGVVLESDVTVYKGPGASYQRQFEQPLQPGVEFTLRERRGQWWRIELADGNNGWIPNRVAALVPPGERTNVAFLGEW